MQSFHPRHLTIVDERRNSSIFAAVVNSCGRVPASDQATDVLFAVVQDVAAIFAERVAAHDRLRLWFDQEVSANLNNQVNVVAEEFNEQRHERSGTCLSVS